MFVLDSEEPSKMVELDNVFIKFFVRTYQSQLFFFVVRVNCVVSPFELLVSTAVVSRIKQINSMRLVFH